MLSSPDLISSCSWLDQAFALAVVKCRKSGSAVVHGTPLPGFQSPAHFAFILSMQLQTLARYPVWEDWAPLCAARALLVHERSLHCRPSQPDPHWWAGRGWFEEWRAIPDRRNAQIKALNGSQYGASGEIPIACSAVSINLKGKGRECLRGRVCKDEVKPKSAAGLLSSSQPPSLPPPSLHPAPGSFLPSFEFRQQQFISDF